MHPAWVWNMGEAMLPLEYTLYRTSAGGVGWVPRDAADVREFQRLMAQHKEGIDWLTVPSCAKLRALNSTLACTPAVVLP